MTIASFTSSLKALLTESNWPWVFSALSLDPLVWESLDGELGLQAIERQSNQPEDYSPAALALLALGITASAESLRNANGEEIQPAIDPEVNPTSPLAQSGLAALQLREARKTSASWDALFRLKGINTPTTLACLYTIIPDQADMLRAAYSLEASDKSRPSINPTLQALLSNPLAPAVHLEALNELVSDLPRSERLELLGQLQRYRPDLAPPIAQVTLNLEPSFLGTPSNGNGDGLRGLAQIEKSFRAARLHMLAQSTEQALNCLNEATLAARQVQAKVSAQIAQIIAQTNDSSAQIAAWEEAVQLDPGSADHITGLILALLDNERFEEAEKILAQEELDVKHSGILFANARLAMMQGNSELARQYAIQATTSMKNNSGSVIAAVLTGPELASMLLELDAPSEAARAAEIALANRPNDPQLLALLARANLAAHRHAQAVQAAHLATALLPDQLDFRRLLAECLELTGDWSAALQERLILLDRTESSTAPELRALANCALHAGQSGRTAHICQLLIKEDKKDGLAWSMLGQATAELGDTTAALDHLQHATQLTPELSAPWLALAQLYENMGQPQKALETLQASALTAPDQPEIHLALAEAYLAENASTQALSSLRMASSLVAEKSVDDTSPDYWVGTSKIKAGNRSLADQIALRLGQTLHQLGHHDEGRQTLEEAYSRSPNDIDVAQAYARVLLALGNVSAAIEPLETVVKAGPSNVTPYLDYARSVLELQSEHGNGAAIENAISAIRSAQELEPDNLEVPALLAFALAANNELPPAMEAYRQALESDLAQDPHWLARLSLGLGKAAHQLGQIETAIAALQEASQADPSNSQIQRSLSEAYDSAGLVEDAYQAARAALLLAPGDVENLNWFANQVLNLKGRPGGEFPDAHNEAIESLERATQIAPQRGDLWLRLGGLQLQSGNRAGAVDALMYLADPESPVSESSANNLYQAAQWLNELGKADSAVICLERALQSGLEAHTPAGPSLLDMLTSLCAAHRQVGDLPAALQALDQAIAINPDEPELYLQKADILLGMSQTDGDANDSQAFAEQGVACLEAAMKLNPHNPDLHYRAALTHRAAGELHLALVHATEMVDISASLSQAMRARSLAADLSLAMLQPVQARTFLEANLPPSPPNEMVEDNVLLDYYTMRAELALEAGDERGAVEELVHILEVAPDDPRLLAIQARVILQRDDPQAASSMLENVLKGMGDPSKARLALLRSAAQAALELGQWEVAIQLCQQAISTAPLEPRSHLDLGRTLVLRAEFSTMCQALGAIGRAGDQQAFSDEIQPTVETALQKTEEQIKAWEADGSIKLANSQNGETSGRIKIKWVDPEAQIHRWRTRGQAIFQPGSEAVKALAALPPTADDAAARIACLREMGDLTTAGLVARDYPQHPLVLLQLALTLLDEKPRQAMAAIHAAADSLSQATANRRFRSAFSLKEISPLVYALLANLFHRDGNRVSDRDNALQAILNALSIWPDEPRWHVLAAEIYLAGDPMDSQGDLEAAINHLERATKLDPEYTPSLIVLGQMYLREGSIQRAMQTFEQAAQAAPGEAEPWMWLAQACRSMGKMEQAAAHAERAVTLAPNYIKPLILRGEIALQDENPRGALSRAEAALRIQPNDPDALLLQVRALNALDRYEEALGTLEKALSLASDPLPLSMERVRLLRRAQGNEAALHAIQSLADHYPDEPRVMTLQAEVLEAAGDSEAAIRAAQRALRGQAGAPVISKVDQASLHFLLGRLLRSTGQLDQSLHHLSEAIHLAPDQVNGYLEMGHVHLERREHTQALSAYRQAITVSPGDYRAYYSIGLALKESRDYVGAEKMLRRAAELAPDDVSIHRLLGAVVALNLVHNRREPTREASRPM